MTRIAPWPPKQNNRTYLYSTGEKIPPKLTGSDLPAKGFVNFQQLYSNSEKIKLLESVQLFTNLPLPFYKAYLAIQMSDNPFDFSESHQNKNISVRECISQHPTFTAGPLHPDNWQLLGWVSEEAYQSWLDSLMLFAFSHCTHYCSATRLIDERKKNNDKKMFYFIQKTEEELLNSPKQINIFTVTGFNYSNFKVSANSTIESTLLDVYRHSSLTMNQILRVAEETKTTDIVLSPFGLGAFIEVVHKHEKKLKEFIMQGLLAGLKSYQGPPVTIHCCGPADFYKTLLSASNPLIHILDKTDKDPYTVANYVQDLGDENRTYEKEYDSRIGPRPIKSMLINDGDAIWTALLDREKKPGLFSDNKTLYNSLLDEYLALVTNFAFYSIQNLMKVFDLVTSNKIVQISEPTKLEGLISKPNRGFFKKTASKACDNNSTLEPEFITKIKKLITTLDKEISSCWPYPNKDRKKLKVEGLVILLEKLSNMDPDIAVSQVEKQFTNHLGVCLLREGNLSTRTSDLLDEIRSEGNQSLTRV